MLSDWAKTRQKHTYRAGGSSPPVPGGADRVIAANPETFGQPIHRVAET